MGNYQEKTGHSGVPDPRSQTSQTMLCCFPGYTNKIHSETTTNQSTSIHQHLYATPKHWGDTESKKQSFLSRTTHSNGRDKREDNQVHARYIQSKWKLILKQLKRPGETSCRRWDFSRVLKEVREAEISGQELIIRPT